jgi:multidrug efflux pump subunit AcrA (membrane-fusion protein)
MSGIAVFIWLKFLAEGPQREAKQEQVRTLRFIQAEPVDVVPRVLGYGTANPARVWRGIAEVEGRVTEVHPELEPGAFLKQDELVLKINPREYKLAISRLESEIAEIKAKLSELKAKKKNEQASLEIEKTSLEIAEADLERLRKLREDAVATAAEVRQQRRTYLTQKQKVQSLQNSLRLVDEQRKTLQASLAVRNARLEQARLDLEKTIIKTPFPCRLAEAQLEKGQYLKTGEVICEAHGTDSTEVNAEIPINRARTLIPPEANKQTGGIPSMEKMRELFDVEVIVRMRIGDFAAEWPARFSRLRERLDPVTRTLSFVVVVDNPYKKAIPGMRPPLVKGTFCEVELRAKPLPGRIVIPRTALHENNVYVLNNENRLQRRSVKIYFEQSDFLCIKSGLQAGDRVVISDPTPAIEGMLVNPVQDDSLQTRIRSQAGGRTPIR